MDDPLFPIELLDVIATTSVYAYRAMLAIPRFARSITNIKNYMKLFGYSYKIMNDVVYWYLNGELWCIRLPEEFNDIHPQTVRKWALVVTMGKSVVVKYRNGLKVWFSYGKMHRLTHLYSDGKPAVEFPDGTKEWWTSDVLHRREGPAVIRANGDKYWYLHGEQHRHTDFSLDSEPAVELTNGTKEWWFMGKRHRDGGFPAVVRADGLKEWWVNGKLLKSTSTV
jgi:hypothetical protein